MDTVLFRHRISCLHSDSDPYATLIIYLSIILITPDSDPLMKWWHGKGIIPIIYMLSFTIPSMIDSVIIP